MSYKQVKYYQEIGDYAAAYRVAREDWTAHPELTWPRSTIAWLLISLMKVYVRVYGQQRFFELLQEFRDLDIPSDNIKLWGAIVWPIRDVVEDSLRMQWFTPKLGDTIFDAIKDMPFDRPSDSYSALVKVFIPIGSLWPRLDEFIEWWGFDNFTSFDYRRYPEKGRMVSLVEKVLIAYLVALRRTGRTPSEEFYKTLDVLSSHSHEQAENIKSVLDYGKH